MRIDRIALAATLFMAPFSALQATAEPAQYNIDPTHFSVVFNAQHVGYGATWGMFLKGEGGFTYDEENQTLSDLAVTIPAESVFSNHDARDNHLRGKDFLHAEEHPVISFVMTSAEPKTDTTGLVYGDLTLRGISKPVTLEVTLNKIEEYPFAHRKRTIGVTATTVLTRSEWGMTYAVDGGLVGDEVPIIIELEANKAE